MPARRASRGLRRTIVAACLAVMTWWIPTVGDPVPTGAAEGSRLNPHPHPQLQAPLVTQHFWVALAANQH